MVEYNVASAEYFDLADGMDRDLLGDSSSHESWRMSDEYGLCVRNRGQQSLNIYGIWRGNIFVVKRQKKS